MARLAPPSDPTPAFRAEAEARLGRAARALELEVLASRVEAALDGEILEVDPERPLVVSGRGELRVAFGTGPQQAFARLQSQGAKPQGLEAWGTPGFLESAEAFALGAGLPFHLGTGPQTAQGILALGFTSGDAPALTPGALLLSLEGPPGVEGLALGAQARGLDGLDLAPVEAADLLGWARSRSCGLEADLGAAGAWGFAVIPPGEAAALGNRLGAWGLRAVEKGRITGGPSVLLRGNGELELGVDLSLEGWPAPFAAPPEVAPDAAVSLPADLAEGEVEPTFRTLLQTGFEASSPEARWHAHGEDGSLAIRVASDGDRVALDPFWGAASVAAEAALGLACVGADALGVALVVPGDVSTSTLMGLRQACVSLDLPVMRVQREPGLATPVVVALGCVDAGAAPVDVDAPEARGLTTASPKVSGVAYRRAFDGLFLLGDRRGELGGSRILALRGGREACPEPWLDETFRLQACVREGVRLGLFRSARQVGRGGLLVAARDGAREARLGCHLLLGGEGLRLDSLCFGEAPGRVLVTTSGEGESALRTLARTHRVPFAKVGMVGGARFTVAVDGVPMVDVELGEL
ncbi:MAG: hypothetical protein HYZ13_09385 [Acidobacteria bacterium]|nr:hypothetical protein [Acidobacteriota bacterium]